MIASGHSMSSLVSSISIPSRYTHSPVEIVDLDDLENTVKLAAEFIFHSGELVGKNFLDT